MDLNPQSIRLRREGEAIYVEVDGARHRVDRVAKAFPRSNPERYLGLLDPEGHEIGLIEDPERLDPASREILADEVRRIYFVPTIAEIISVEPQGIGTLWQVTTDDGEKSFRVADRDALDGSQAPGITVSDDRGKRFRIEDYWALDRESRDAIRDLLPDKVLRVKYGSGRW